MRAQTLLAGFFLVGLFAAAPANAQTLSYADAVTKLAQDCGADIKKLCTGLNLGGGRIADCLEKNDPKVSATCKGTLSSVVASISQRERAQTSYEKVCRHDMSQRCSGVKGDGYVLACLIKTQKHVGKECNQAITDAGWR